MITEYLSPLGKITLAGGGESITGLWFQGQKYFGRGLGPDERQGHLPVFDQAAAWLDAYFSGRRPPGLPPLAPSGTAFQRAVWQMLLRIPYGETTSYGAVARQLGLPAASRAVGSAVGRNPIAIFVPCHRVIAASGALTGYAGGLERKRRLLQLERGEGI